ncbi:Helicase C-terminal [Penicillium canescens]|nr:Helicase C-terminal [Penicillium canescens]
MALAMMIEKERGEIERTDFPSLWEIQRDVEGNVSYRHVVTGRSQVDCPQPTLGGILADEMGLGKTLSALALIAWYLDAATLSKSASRTTLVVTTLSISAIPGWQHQIEKYHYCLFLDFHRPKLTRARHFWPESVRMALYHGSNRHSRVSDIPANDIVITTYDTLRHEWSTNRKNSALFCASRNWARVILDEAHHIRNRSSKTFQAACAIPAVYRWCLTGTPIHNRLDDLGALLTFLGVTPFIGQAAQHAFRYWMNGPIQSSRRHLPDLSRLRKLIGAVCLRRTKRLIGSQLKLSLRIDKKHTVELDVQERRLYDFFKRQFSRLVARNMAANPNTNKEPQRNILFLINCLRLICNHGESLLPPTALNLWRSQLSPMDDSHLCEHGAIFRERGETTPVATFDSLSHTLSRAGMARPQSRPSSKVNSLLRAVHQEQHLNHSAQNKSPVKSLIFTYWTKMLDLLEMELRTQNFRFQRIDGQKSLQDRAMALEIFHKDPTCTVMIASIGSVAEGIDLTAASSVHIMEPQWNPMLEEQSLNRAHRIGQTRDVIVNRYIVSNSIEK